VPPLSEAEEDSAAACSGEGSVTRRDQRHHRWSWGQATAWITALAHLLAHNSKDGVRTLGDQPRLLVYARLHEAKLRVARIARCRPSETALSHRVEDPQPQHALSKRLPGGAIARLPVATRRRRPGHRKSPATHAGLSEAVGRAES
jgi:hypothetical protein